MKYICFALLVTWMFDTQLYLRAQAPVQHAAGESTPGHTAVDKDSDLSPPISAAELPIGSGDLVEISLFGTTDFHEEARVTNTGEITLPLIGAVHVAGLSPAQAGSRISKELIDGNFYRNPQVSVLVKEYATEDVYVLGEVQKPGLYPVLKVRNLLQAISLAGGTTQKAGRNVVISNKNRPDNRIVATLSGDGPTNPEVLPGDTIVVQKAGIVYVVGDVHQPTGIVLENENLTVLQAIAMAQGTNPDAALSHAKLIRKGPDGPQQMDLPLKKMLSARAPDVKVQAEDIIFVPKSTATAFSKRGLEAAIQAATGVAMYHTY
jgi:polysaccharide export outer membrane protein